MHSAACASHRSRRESSTTAALSIWKDRFVFTSQRFIGEVTSCRPAIVIHVAVRGEVTIETGNARHTGRILAVGPNVKRTLRAVSGGDYTLHLDPVGWLSRWLRQATFSSQEIVRLPDHLDPMTAEWIVAEIETASPGAQSYELSQRVIAALFPNAAAARPIDARIDMVTSWLWTNVPLRTDLRYLSELCGLSPSRLDHLFTSTIGVSIRQYLLWVKMRKAAEMFVRDVRLTEVAHAVGFADSAHLSRTFVRYFGVLPSFLANGRHVRVKLCEP